MLRISGCVHQRLHFTKRRALFFVSGVLEHLHFRTLFPGSLAEEQRALATLGRTYYVYSQSVLEREGNSPARVDELLVRAGHHYLQALDTCDKLTGDLSDREMLEMRSRLYLNLGLVYEDKGNLTSAREFMKKALGVVK